MRSIMTKERGDGTYIVRCVGKLNYEDKYW